jgi:hypothetical protein
MFFVEKDTGLFHVHLISVSAGFANTKLQNCQQNFSIASNVLLIKKQGWFMCILHVLLKLEISLETVFAFFASLMTSFTKIATRLF